MSLCHMRRLQRIPTIDALKVLAETFREACNGCVCLPVAVDLHNSCHISVEAGLIWIVAECACEQAAGHPQYQKLQQVGVDGQVSDKERMCIIMPLTCRLCLEWCSHSSLVRRYNEHMSTNFNILRWSLRQLEIELKGLRTFDAPKTGEGPESSWSWTITSQRANGPSCLKPSLNLSLDRFKDVNMTKYARLCAVHSRPSTQFQVMKRYCKLKFQSSPAAIYLSSVIISSSWWLAFHKVDSRCKDFKKTWQYVAMQSLSWSITKSRLGFHGILDQRSCSVSLQICCHQALHGKAISFM